MLVRIVVLSAIAISAWASTINISNPEISTDSCANPDAATCTDSAVLTANGIDVSQNEQYFNGGDVASATITSQFVLDSPANIALSVSVMFTAEALQGIGPGPNVDTGAQFGSEYYVTGIISDGTQADVLSAYNSAEAVNGVAQNSDVFAVPDMLLGPGTYTVTLDQWGSDSVIGPSAFAFETDWTITDPVATPEPRWIALALVLGALFIRLALGGRARI